MVGKHGRHGQVSQWIYRTNRFFVIVCVIFIHPCIQLRSVQLRSTLHFIHSFIHSFRPSVTCIHVCMSLPSFLLPANSRSYTLETTFDTSGYIPIRIHTYIRSPGGPAISRGEFGQSVGQLETSIQTLCFLAFSPLLSKESLQQ